MDYISQEFKSEFSEHFGNPPNKPPEIIYQYQKLDLEGDYLKTILMRSLYVSDPQSFNDPFDCWPVVDNDTNNPKFCSGKRFDLSMQNKSINAGIVCLTTSYDNSLMWAHYAENNTGICLGYKLNESSFTFPNHPNIPDMPFAPVQYKELEIIKGSALFNQDGGSSEKGIFENIVFRKNPEWCYEKEWRLLFSSKWKKSRITEKDLNIELSEIIFGIHTPQENIESLKDILHGHGISPKLYQIEFSFESLGYVRREM